jgi:hypothetical protein
MRGEIAASRDYEPIRDLPRRCDGYAPGADDADRRPATGDRAANGGRGLDRSLTDAL